MELVAKKSKSTPVLVAGKILRRILAEAMKKKKEKKAILRDLNSGALSIEKSSIDSSLFD